MTTEQEAINSVFLTSDADLAANRSGSLGPDQKRRLVRQNRLVPLLVSPFLILFGVFAAISAAQHQAIWKTATLAVLAVGLWAPIAVPSYFESRRIARGPGANDVGCATGTGSRINGST